MTNVDAWIFSIQTLSVHDYFLMRTNITGSMDTIQDLQNIKVTGDESNFTWEFWRQRDTGDENDIILDCNQQMFVSFAVGTGLEDAVSYHGPNRGNLLVSFQNIQSIFPAPILWSADINDVFTPITISCIVLVPFGILFVFFMASLADKVEVTEIIVGIVVCGQDAISDYLLIGEW